MNLYAFQKEAVNKFFNVSKGRMIAALPTGAGKTVVALAIIKQVIEKKPDIKILVIVPANLRNNLIENIQKFKLKIINAVVIRKTSELKYLHDHYNVFIVSYNFLRMYCNEILSYKWNMIVADEIHYAKNMSTKNFKCLWQLTQVVEYFLGLTASYVSNNLEEFFTIIALIANDRRIITLGKKLIKYERFGQQQASFVSKLLLGAKDEKGRLVQVGVTDPYTFKKLVYRYIFLPKNEKIIVIGKRPKPISIVKQIKLSDHEWKAYNYVIGKIPKHLLKLLSQGDINDEQLRRIKNQIMAAQQVLITPDYIVEGEFSKRPSTKVIECAKQLSLTGHKAIVFTPFLEHGAKVVHNYFKSIGIKSALYAGPIKPQERQQIQNQFEEGDLQVIVLTGAGKEGINLPSAKEVHFLSLAWNPEDLEQVMGRALRITSQNDVVHIYWWFAQGPKGQETIDHWMNRVLERKRLLKKVVYTILSENVTANVSAAIEPYEGPKEGSNRKCKEKVPDIFDTSYPH